MTFIIVFFTTIILPAIFLETSFARYGEMDGIIVGRENSFYILCCNFALIADVFLPVPNGLTNTFAGATLGWALASIIVWVGLNFGAVFGYLVGRYAGKAFSDKNCRRRRFRKSRKFR